MQLPGILSLWVRHGNYVLVGDDDAIKTNWLELPVNLVRNHRTPWGGSEGGRLNLSLRTPLGGLQSSDRMLPNPIAIT